VRAATPFTIVMGIGTLLASLAPETACSSQRRRPADRASTPLVATVGGTPIRAADIAAQMRAKSIGAMQALSDLMTFEILARAAAPEAEDPTREEQEELRDLKVQRLVEREIEPRISPAAIEDGEMRSVYERGKARFVHDRLVQIQILCLFTGARMKPEARARVEDNARRLRALLQTRVPTARGATAAAPGFEEIAKDPVWIDRKVSLTTVWQQEDQPFPLVVGRAVQALSRPGDTTDLVGDETGYYIARYLAEKAPENVSFADAEPLIRREMYEPWRRQKFLQLSLGMSRAHDIEVFPENFPRLAAESPEPPSPQ
jgi:hypothetical protein